MTDRPGASVARAQRRRPVVGVSLSTAMAVGAILPPFLLAATLPTVSGTLALPRTTLAVAITAFFVVSAVTAPLAGRTVEWLGERMALAVAGLSTGMALALVVLPAPISVRVAAFCIPGGIGNGLVQPTTNQLIVRQMPGRRAMSIAVKQAAFPGATLLAGLAVPVVASQVDPRGLLTLTGAVIAATALVGGALLGHGSGVSRGELPSIEATPNGQTHWLVGAGLASFLAALAAGGLAALIVDWAVVSGRSASGAGVALAVASLLSGLMRLLSGWWAEVHRGHFAATSAMLLLGSAGYLLLPFVRSEIGLVVALMLALSVGWGWDGLVLFGVLSRANTTVARATGLVIAGLALGTGVGPVVLSAIAGSDGANYDLAWAVAGALSVSAAVGMLVLHRRVNELPRGDEDPTWPAREVRRLRL